MTDIFSSRTAEIEAHILSVKERQLIDPQSGWYDSSEYGTVEYLMLSLYLRYTPVEMILADLNRLAEDEEFQLYLQDLQWERIEDNLEQRFSIDVLEYALFLHWQLRRMK